MGLFNDVPGHFLVKTRNNLKRTFGVEQDRSRTPASLSTLSAHSCARVQALRAVVRHGKESASLRLQKLNVALWNETGWAPRAWLQRAAA